MAGNQDQLEDKLSRLREAITKCGSLLVAFSGGIDSAFLLKIAHDELGDKAIGATVLGPFFPLWEIREASDFVEQYGIPYRQQEVSLLRNPIIASNPPRRCYYCKQEMLKTLARIAREEEIEHIAVGENFDDTEDFRPGMDAVQEAGVLTPLKDAGLGKEDIRTLARQMGLPLWDKPASACLASRIPYGQTLTPAKLWAIQKAEAALREMGFRQCRVRHHGETARIEVPERDIFHCAGVHRDQILKVLHELGFTYVTLDLDGYRMGSMNATAPSDTQRRIGAPDGR